jgi:uncharacterized protein YceK
MKTKCMLLMLLSANMLLFGGGCASVIGHTAGAGRELYPGVRLDSYVLTEKNDELLQKLGPRLTALAAMDLPLSAALDTALLPFDAIHRLVTPDRAELMSKRNAAD